MRKIRGPNNPWNSPKRWCTTALGFAEICSIHVVIYTRGRAGVRLQRAEEGALCRGCRHRKIYCNVGDSGDTAARCQSNMPWGLKRNNTEEGQWSIFHWVTAHLPKLTQIAFLLFLLVFMFQNSNPPPLNHSGWVCQQVVPPHKSSYAHLPYSLCREIPQGSGSTSANTNWKRDPPAGKLERQTWRQPRPHDA